MNESGFPGNVKDSLAIGRITCRTPAETGPRRRFDIEGTLVLDTRAGQPFEHVYEQPRLRISRRTDGTCVRGAQVPQIDSEICHQRPVQPRTVFDLVVPARIVNDAFDHVLRGHLRSCCRSCARCSTSPLEQPQK